MTINYNRNAKIYDKRHGEEIAPEIAVKVIEVARLKAGDLLLDLASGTGRGCLAFARQGMAVTATDVSADMLAKLSEKAVGLDVSTQLAKADALPFEEDIFDAVSISRALYLIKDWRDVISEAARVLKPGGVFIHEWGSGSETDVYGLIRGHLRDLLLQAGVKQIFHPGARTEAQVEAEIFARGFTAVGAVETGPGLSITPREFIDKIINRECSYLWDVSDDIAAPVMEKVWDYTRTEFGDLDQEIFMPENSWWRVYNLPREACR